MGIQKYFPLIIAILGTVPGIMIRCFQPDMNPIMVAFFTGFAIFSSSILLMWACETAQLDIPQALSISLVVLIAVLPEYVVDMYFTWMAGQEPTTMYRNYAIANMTGANRLLIGVGWSAIIILYAIRYRKPVQLDLDKRTEIFFLLIATIYAFIIPYKATLSWYDTLLFLGAYLWYIYIIMRQKCQSVTLEGFSKVLAKFPTLYRRIFTSSLFLFSAIVIFMNAGLFSENLVASGSLLNINEFLLVQWIAPIASESPEFIVATMFVLRGQASISLGSLLSAKLNQWTLLVGMIPLVYAFSSGHIIPPMSMSLQQAYEILLTASQSLLAISLLLTLYITIREALVLFVLFLLQFLSPLYSDFIEVSFDLYHNPERFHIYFSIVYILLALCIFMKRYKDIVLLKEGLTS